MRIPGSKKYEGGSKKFRCAFVLLTSSFVLLTSFSAGCGPPPRPAQPAAPDSPATIASGGLNRPEHRQKPYVILISLDDVKPEYLDRFNLLNFRLATERGVLALRMIPVFPSLTFPNHYSLVTGLSAERDGIVSYSFFDPAQNQTYSLSDRATVADGS